MKFIKTSIATSRESGWVAAPVRVWARRPARATRASATAPVIMPSAVFEGGQMPLVRRIPKRGFHHKFALDVAAINVSDLQLRFEAGEEVSPATLKTRGLVKGRYDLLKVLGDGELTKSLKIFAHRFSARPRRRSRRRAARLPCCRARTGD